jgi:transposase
MHVPPRDRQVLESWARSTSVRAGLAQRALIVLLAADGERTSEIVARTGASKPTVSAWKKRYAVEGLGGLQDRRKPGRPRRTDDAAIVLATLEPPPERLGVKHWSSRLLASELGMSNVRVAETWRLYGLEPWRREPFRFSTDPRLTVASRALTGLYLNPPDHAVVLSMTDERGRPGAQDLLAALEAVAGRVATSTAVTYTGATTAYYPRRRHRAYLHFLQQATATYPRAELNVVAVDNYATRRHPEIRAWLARHPWISAHFTPTQRTWVTMTEIFAGLSADSLNTGGRNTGTRATGTSETGLSAAITTVIDSWTDGSQPFAWTRPADEFRGGPSASGEDGEAILASQDRADVRTHRRVADLQALGHRPVVGAVDHEPQDLLLAWRQPSQQLRLACLFTI